MKNLTGTLINVLLHEIKLFKKVKINYQRTKNMPESTQIIIGILALAIVLILAMLGTGWWTKKICMAIMRDLETKGAVNEVKAVALPYDKVQYFRIGYRDYRPKALEMLIISEAVCRTEDGRYYLNQEKTNKP